MTKRSEFKTFINIGTTGTPIWALLGLGITTGTINYNASTSEEVYIHQDSGTTEIESYKPTMPVEAKHDLDDPAIQWLDEKRKLRPIGTAAYTEILNVWYYEPMSSSKYPAERQSVAIQFESFGGEGGMKNVMNFTLNYRGDRVTGGFNPTTLAFTTDVYFLYA